MNVVTAMREAKKPMSDEERKRQIVRANTNGSNWLFKANIAEERGDYELAQRHLARSQPWLDIQNELEGYNDDGR